MNEANASSKVYCTISVYDVFVFHAIFVAPRIFADMASQVNKEKCHICDKKIKTQIQDHLLSCEGGAEARSIVICLTYLTHDIVYS